MFDLVWWQGCPGGRDVRILCVASYPLETGNHTDCSSDVARGLVGGSLLGVPNMSLVALA
jgi:hypothetical protein